MKLGLFPMLGGRNTSRQQNTQQSLEPTNGSLLSACWQGNLALVKYLVEYHGHSLNQRDWHTGMTPLLLAAQHGHLELLQYIAATQEVDLWQVDAFCQLSVLHRACEQGLFDIVQWWMTHQETRSSDDEDTTKNLSAMSDDAQDRQRNSQSSTRIGLVQLEQTDSKGSTPLMMACQKGHTEIAQYLVTIHSANAHAVNHHGMTPLTLALRHSHWDIAQWLLTVVKVSIQTSPSPLHIICEHAAQASSSSSSFANTNNHHQSNTAPSSSSSHLHAVIMIPLLLHYGANIHETVTDDGQTLLWVASHAGNAPVVEYFLHELQMDIQPTLAYMGGGCIVPTTYTNNRHSSMECRTSTIHGIEDLPLNEKRTTMPLRPIWEDYPLFPPHIRAVWKRRADFLEQRWKLVDGFLGGTLDWFRREHHGNSIFQKGATSS